MMAESASVRIVVLTGQSNSLGTSADPAERDPSPGIDPLDARIPFFWANRSTRAGDGPAVLIGTSDGAIRTLCAQQGEGANPLFWGPEIGFARTLAHEGVSDFLIVKASRGGGGNGFWFRDSADDHMYRHVIHTVIQAIAALPSDTAFTMDTLLYVQGESDSDDEARVSGERLCLLADHLRADLPNARDMRVIVGGIAAPGERRDLVRAQQSTLPLADPRIAYVDTLDLQSQLYDQLHFAKPAKLELGRRMAQAWLARHC